MRLALTIFVAVLALVGAAAVFVYIALPTDFVREELAARVNAATGRLLTVAGPISLAFYPQASVTLDDVAISPPAGMQGQPTLQLHVLTLQVPLWPLLKHELVIERIDIEGPVIELRTDRDGRRSWDLRKDVAAAPELRGSEGSAASTAPTAPSGQPAPPATPKAIAGVGDLHLPAIHITSGTVRLIDERTGLNETLSDVNLTVGVNGISEPAHLQGSVTWSGEPTTVEGSAGPIANLATGDPADFDFEIVGRLAKTKLRGRLAQLAPTPITGRIDLTANSLRELLRWLKRPLPEGSGFGPVVLAADFAASRDGAAARNAQLTLDGSTASGDISMSRGKDRPVLHANLKLDRLDLNTYLGAAIDKPQSATAAYKDATKPEAPSSAAGNSGAWSDVPIDLSAFGSFDADVNLGVGALQWHAIKLGKSALHSVLKDGVLKMRLSEMEIYGGKGSGTVSLDGHGAVPRLEASFALHSVNAQPFLSDAIGLTRVAGRGDVSFGFEGSGRSQRDIVKALMGQGHMELTDGAVMGIDFAKGFAALQNGQITGWQNGPDAKTPFGSMTASCTITNGVADSRDFALTSPLLRLTGGGTASLPDKTLDYTVLAGLDDSGGNGSPSELSLPLRVTGPWAKPAVTIDVAGIAKNPQAAINTVKKAVDKFANSKQGKALGDFIGGLLNKANKSNDAPADPAPAQ